MNVTDDVVGYLVKELDLAMQMTVSSCPTDESQFKADIKTSIANQLSVGGALYGPSDVIVSEYDCSSQSISIGRRRLQPGNQTITYLATVLVRDGNIEVYGIDPLESEAALSSQLTSYFTALITQSFVESIVAEIESLSSYTLVLIEYGIEIEIVASFSAFPSVTPTNSPVDSPVDDNNNYYYYANDQGYYYQGSSRRLSSTCSNTIGQGGDNSCHHDSDCCNPSAKCGSDNQCHLQCSLPHAPTMSPVATGSGATPQPSSVNHANSLGAFRYTTLQIFKDASTTQMSSSQATAYSKAIAAITGVDISDVSSFSVSKQKKVLTNLYKVIVNIEVAHADVPSEYQNDYEAYAVYLDGIFTNNLSEILAEYNKQLSSAGLPTEDSLTILGYITGNATTASPTLTPDSSTASSSDSGPNMSDGAVARTVLGVMAGCAILAITVFCFFSVSQSKRREQTHNLQNHVSSDLTISI
jgi:hypothetical protein